MSQDILPDGSHSKSNDLRKQVRKAERDPWNRILSVLQDAEWVISFCQRELPNISIIPNLRCGAWYVPPISTNVEGVKGCYFKSTDGHINEWGFSLKRYNPAILTLIQERGACIIVDSTRRGKSMPDALSKTIPIWCAVINEASRYKYGLSLKFKDTFRIAEHVISQSERSQIVSRMEDWVEDLLDSDLEIPNLDKPLKPIFVSRSYVDHEVEQIQLDKHDYYPIILISASPMVSTPSLIPQKYEIGKDCLEDALGLAKDVQILRRESEFIYVQGSGDDEEMWSSKLTPSLLWESDNIKQILRTKGDEMALKTCLEMIVMQNKIENFSLGGTDAIKGDVQIGDLGIWFGRRTQTHVFEENEKEKYDLIIHADGDVEDDSKDSKDGQNKILKLNLESGKRGLNGFRQCIPKAISAAQQKPFPKTILLCSSEQDGIGYDLNGSLAVCILATCFDEEKNILHLPDHQPFIPSNIIKDDVQKRLQWISTFIPQAKPPSRKHMLRINEVLLGQEIKAQADEQRRRDWM